jgi:hypothetical protein
MAQATAPFLDSTLEAGYDLLCHQLRNINRANRE